MTKIRYTQRSFSSASLEKIQQANVIIDEYEKQGFELTLRQLYYQFVSRDLIENTDKAYKRLGSVINDARLAGLIDWEAIVDRTRNLQSQEHWNGPAELIAACSRWYLTDRWQNQGYRVEVWIEKDALIGVIENVCDKYDVPYFSCRGYTSQSEMWAAAQRLITFEDGGQHTRIIHLGDHDPSGIDMSRDIQSRLEMFGSTVEVRRIALNMHQIEKYEPPPNPAKVTDSRARKYIAEHGDSSWELDALEPSVMADLIRMEIDEVRAADLWNEAVDEEEASRECLTNLSTRWEEIRDQLE